MRQYLDAKRQHPDALVFFRMGDFYEMFYEDALVTARALELTLTSRSKDGGGSAIPMCGVPYHAADTYVARLVKKGFRVAICEQVEDPKKAKGLVRREVVRVVSPGTLTDSAYLDAREPAFLMAIAPSRSLARPAPLGPPGPPGPLAPPAADAPATTFGIALLDLSTGEFTAAEYAGAVGRQAMGDEVAVLQPREIVVPADFDVATHVPEVAAAALLVTTREPWTFEPARAEQVLTEQLRADGLDGFGLTGHAAATSAAGALVQYLHDTQQGDLPHVRTIAFRQASGFLLIDPPTLKHLEVIEATGGGRVGSLLHEIDRTVTVMGGRRLRAWLLRPLVAVEPIQDRLDAVEDFAFRTTERGKLRDLLKGVHDLERLGGAYRPWHRQPARSRRAQGVDRGDSPCAAATGRDACARSSRASSGSWTIWGISAPTSPRRSSTTRRRWRATAAASETMSMRNSMSCVKSAEVASGASPTWRSASVAVPASGRSRSGTTECSATTSRSRRRTWARSRPIIIANRRSRVASGSSPRR